MVEPGSLASAPGPGGTRARVWHPEYETILASAVRAADAELARAQAGVIHLRAALAAWTPGRRCCRLISSVGIWPASPANRG